MLQALDRVGAARAALERALRIYEGAFGPGHPRANDARRRLAAARRQSGDARGALELALVVACVEARIVVASTPRRGRGYSVEAGRGGAATWIYLAWIELTVLSTQVAARASAATGGSAHASDLLEVARLLNALDADRVGDVLSGDALGPDDAIARMSGVEMMDAVQRLDADAPAAPPPRGTRGRAEIFSRENHVSAVGASTEYPHRGRGAAATRLRGRPPRNNA